MTGEVKGEVKGEGEGEVGEKVEVEVVKEVVKEQEASAMVPLLDRPFLEEAPRGKLPSEADTIAMMYHQSSGTFKGFQGKQIINPSPMAHSN